MRIHIQSLRFDTIIGLLEFEREQEQTILVDLEAEYIYDKQTFINYADLAALIKTDLKKERYMLLEEALSGLKKKIIEAYPAIRELKLKIAKPDILEDCTVALSDSWKFSPAL